MGRKPKVLDRFSPSGKKEHQEEEPLFALFLVFHLDYWLVMPSYPTRGIT